MYIFNFKALKPENSEKKLLFVILLFSELCISIVIFRKYFCVK